MAADILIYQADQVPVGDDQRQHLELTRDLATRFNNRFGQTFTVPEGFIPEAGARVMDLQSPDKKMSKSLPPAGCVDLLDEPSASAKKIRSAVTDTGREVVADAANKPGVTNLLVIHSALSGRSIADLEEQFAGRGYGDLKKELAEVVTDFVTPVRARTTELLDDPAELERLLADGAARAREVASRTVAQAYERVGFLAPASGGSIR
jgi:tryptophanyl-tRNA synthetase